MAAGAVVHDSSPDIGRALEALAATQPTAPAIHTPGRPSLNFAGLAAQIRSVRELLTGWGIGRGDAVVGVIPSRPEMAVASVSIPAAAAFAPLSPSLSAEEYVEMLHRLVPKAVVVAAGADHPLRTAAVRCGVAEIQLTGDSLAGAGAFTLQLARSDESLQRPARLPHDVAYVMKTSGTTGRCKLVPWTHRIILAGARGVAAASALSASDVGYHIVPMHTSHGVRTGLSYLLLSGSSLVVPTDLEVDTLFDALESYRVTWFTASPTVLREAVARIALRHDTVARASLRLIRASSSQIEPEEIERVERAFGVPLRGVLSSTEASVIAQEPLPPRARKLGSVGLPVLNEIAIMDDAGAFCAAGAGGEVLVRGPLVFEGYLDDPAANAEAFVAGWFRTGDMGHLDEDGFLYLTGRKKDLINRGGEKISPSEVDAAIAAISGIREAATFGIPHRTLGEEVVVAVVKEDGAEISGPQIVDELRQRVGPQRSPRRVYFVDHLPRNDLGKIRRAELPRVLGLDRAAGEPAADAISLGPLEIALAGLWTSVLQVRGVGPHDDFFLLGGDSQSSARLQSGVKAVFGVDIPIQDLFADSATLTGMARAIGRARSGGATGTEAGAGPAAPSPIGHRRQHCPAILSATQKRMWFLARLEPGSSAYNLGRAYRLEGELDTDALRQSVRYVGQRHDVLRAVYTLIDGEPRQIVREGATVEMQMADLSAAQPAERNDALQRLLCEVTERPFDLETGPMVRFVLVRLAEREHVLLRTWHHIVSDGWSAGILERELSAAYRALVAGRQPELPALPMQYADYAARQGESLQGKAVAGELAYWKARLAELPVLDLPTDRARPPVKGHAGTNLVTDLPASLARALRELSQRERATLFMTLLAAFKVLLWRYSGEEDIAVGTPIAGRRSSELEGLIGFFANTLVLRTDLTGNPSFCELLARVRKSALDAYAHQDVPFEKLVEELSPARDLSRNPMFEVMFALQNVPGSALALENVLVSRLALPTFNARFDLSLLARETARGLEVRWEYSTDLFDAATIERMARHFERLLEAIVADPDERIGHLSLLGESERRRLLAPCNETGAVEPVRCLHELFEEQAARTPAAVAVEFENQRLSYGELDARASQLARHLAALGVGPEVVVGICMERSLELVVGLFAILKAGGACLPLDPRYPRERLAFMLQDTAAPVLLTQEALLKDLSVHGARIVCIDRDAALIAAHASAPARSAANVESLAYVVYTSGSTGQPKGVAMPHAPLANLLAWHRQDGSAGRVAQFTSISFDVSLQEILHALTSGKTLVVVPSDTQLRPEKLAAFLQEAAVTDLFAPTVVLEHLARAVLETQCDLAALRNVYQAGEALTITPALQEFFRRHPACRLHNHYGPAESHVVTATTLPADPGSWIYRPAIGVPVPNARIYILDANREPVPPGVPGELYIAGPVLARGYLNRPELTAERFLCDPYAPGVGARMYRTGDLARHLPGGNIEYLGRIDDQVKIRGFRIEPGEIEAALAAHAAVRQVVVLAREDVPGTKRLVAYVVPAAPSFDGIEALRAFLHERLPQYMIPSAFVLLERLPLTANGKIDRRALPAPSPPLAAGAPQAAPRDQVERILCTIWAETLGVAQIGLDDNFFDVGGHSLLAASLFARLDRALGRMLPLSTLFEAPTVRGLARFYRDGAEPTSNCTLIPITAGGSRPILFAVPGVGGNVVGYVDLARALGAEQPFYGLQAVGLDGVREPLESVEDIAAHALSEIRQLQPSGPYYLLGACFGALVAFEMAHQLLGAGEPVAFLGLLDPSGIGDRGGDRRRPRLPEALKRGVALGRFVASRLQLYYFHMRTLSLLEKLRFVRGKAGMLGEISQKRDFFRGDWREFYQCRVRDANLGALRRYRRKLLKGAPGMFEVFATDGVLRRTTSVYSIWNPLAGGAVAYHNVPGKDSGDMLIGANARVLGSILSERLVRARAAAFLAAS